MKRRTLLSALGAAATAAAVPATAHAATRIVFGYTAVSAFASVFVAAEQGYFTKRDLEVELKFIPLNSTIPAALQSDSLQLGGPTPSVFLQAVDGGLDLVVVAGAALTARAITEYGLVARAGSGIRTAQDCIGKKVGVPGLGAFLHVTFRAWLKQNGVDHRKVNFVEASFPQHADLLRGGSVDAVVTADPFMSRATDSGAGYVVSYYSTFLAEGQQAILHVARRDWVQKNPAAARAFREALQEAAAYMVQPANTDKVRAAIGKYTRLPPDAVAKLQIAQPGPVVSEKQIAYWIDLMKDQEMLKNPVDAARLLAR